MRILTLLLLISLLVPGCAMRLRTWPPSLDVAAGDAYIVESKTMGVDRHGNTTYTGSDEQPVIETRGGEGSAGFFDAIKVTFRTIGQIALALMPRGFSSDEGS